MLGKLFKYEMKATSRLFLPLYGLMLVFTIIGRVLFSGMIMTDGQNPIIDMLFAFMMLAYFVLICSTMVMMVVIIIRRFYLNLLGQDGYLMHTLPVTTHQLILSKLFSAFIWQMLTGIILTFSVFGIFVTGEMLEVLPDMMYGFSELTRYLFKAEGARLIFDGILIVFAMILSTIASLIMYYTAMTLGHTVKKHKIWASFGAYFAINFVIQQVSYWGNMLLGGNNIVDMMNGSMYMEGYMPFNESAMYEMYMSSFYIGIALYIMMIAGGYFTTHYIIKNKLNLE